MVNRLSKYLIVLWLLAGCVTATAGWIINPFLDGGGGTPPGGDCPTGTYAASYDGDHSSGVGYVCLNSGGSSIDADENTADSVTTSAVQFDAGNEHLLWNDVEVLPSTGTIYFTVSISDRDSDGTMNGGSFIEYMYSTSTGIEVYSDASTVRLNYYDGTASNCGTIVALAFDTSYRIAASWDQPNDRYSVSIVALGNGPSWVEQTGEGLSPWANTPNSFSIGENVSGRSVNETMSVSDVKIFSGYQANE